MDKLLEWVRQPTTLLGLSITSGALIGNAAGVLTVAVAGTFVGAGLPLLLPDNSTKRADVAAVLADILATTHGALEKSRTPPKT